MLLAAHKLLFVLEHLIPFKKLITISLSDKCLVIQVLFRKEETPFYFMEQYPLEEIIAAEDEYDMLLLFVSNLQDFYNNVRKEDCVKSDLINQTVILKEEVIYMQATNGKEKRNG